MIKPNKLPKEVVNALTPRICDEHKAFYFYKAASNWCNEKGYLKAAKYFDITTNNWKLDKLVPSVLEAVKTKPTVVGVPPVTFKVPVLIEVDDIFPDDTTEVAVTAPAAKPPISSLLTIVFAVLFAVADNTDDATVVMVDDITPPTVFILGKSASPVKSPANLMIPLSVIVASVAFITKVATPPAPCCPEN